jgi:hypothetical protein
VRRELTSSFTRGARFGLLAAASALALSLLAVLVVASPPPTPATAGSATVDPWHQVGEAYPADPPPVEISLELLAVRPPREHSTGLRDLMVELSRLDQEQMLEALPSAEVAETVAGAASAPPRIVTIPNDELYALLAATFPEDAERAYQIVMCESSGNAATNTGNGYYGMWQFDLPTWQSVGGAGLPSDASMDEQIRRARMLYDLRGWAPWSGCVR